jgi:electron transfer flavoprotein beta subunit
MEVEMKILVCIKQVPDMESKFVIDKDGSWYDTTDLAWRMNEYDEYAVEQAIRVKEQVKEADLTVLSIGPDRIKETMKKALAMGCDRGVQVADDAVASREPFQIASIIATFAKEGQFDLVFTGLQSQDRGSCQVGTLVAELLGIPCLTTAVDFDLQGQVIQVKRELEGGVKARVSASLPALVTCQLGLNTPRYPTLPNIMKAKKKELRTLEVQGLLTTAARQRTVKVFLPEKKGDCQILEGDPAELAGRLISIFKEKAGILA